MGWGKLSVLLASIILIFCDSFIAQGYPIYEMEGMVVTASRTSSSFSDLTRSVIVIDSTEISKASSSSLPDLLKYAPGIEVKQMGPKGVRADMGIRGCSFEQALILLDGIKINDPQTGHHNMDLPVSLQNIDRIEILRGNGSSLYGPNAFGGVINIITKKATRRDLGIAASLGQHDLAEGSVSYCQPTGPATQNISFSKKRSDGYRYNTGYDLTTANYGLTGRLGSSTINLLTGYTDKKFGAYKYYYLDTKPDQWEHTKAFIAAASGDFKVNPKFEFSPKLYWKRHDDDYILYRNQPNRYRNNHNSCLYGGESQFLIKTPAGATAFNLEASREVLKSSNLGNRSRNKGGISFEQRLQPIKGIDLLLGGFNYYYQGWGWSFWPSADLGWQATPNLRAFVTAGQSFRPPTFTELYYTGSKLGNPSLTPEKSRCYETGLLWSDGSFDGSFSLFQRNGDNVIDWTRSNSLDIWRARNISKIVTNGSEISFAFYPNNIFPSSFITKIKLGYSFLESDLSTGEFQSSYLLDHFKHQGLAELDNKLPFRLQQASKIRSFRYPNGSGYLIADTKLSWQHSNYTFFVEIENLFNRSFYESGTIPMPGRWIKSGIGLEFF